MENKSWPWNRRSFVTLTYAEVPLTSDFLPTLEKNDLQKFFKRCRKDGYTFRYAAVGEYGEKTHRPHYHALIWGPDIAECNKMVQKHWALGHTLTVAIESGAMCYVGKYILKATEWAPKVKGGSKLQAPFLLSSRRPPIGWDGLQTMGEAYVDGPFKEQLEFDGDISLVYRSSGRWWGIPPRDAKIIREAAGVPTKASERPPKPNREETDDEKQRAESFIRKNKALRKLRATF